MFYTIKKKHTTSAFFSKSFSITRKPAFAYFGKHKKKPFDVVCCLYKMKQSHWLLCRNKELWLVKKNHATIKLDSNSFSCNENLQRKQNWTAKSTNLKENAGKSKGKQGYVFILTEFKKWHDTSGDQELILFNNKEIQIGGKTVLSELVWPRSLLHLWHSRFQWKVLEFCRFLSEIFS